MNRGVDAAGNYDPLPKAADGSDHNGHGTCIASASAGKVYGSGSGASLLSIKMVYDPNDNCAATATAWIEVFDNIVRDIDNNGLRQKAVINLSLGKSSETAIGCFSGSTAHAKVAQAATRLSIGMYSHISCPRSMLRTRWWL